jgi:hypothetical protein
MVRHVTLLVHDAVFLNARTRMASALLEQTGNQGRPRR